MTILRSIRNWLHRFFVKPKSEKANVLAAQLELAPYRRSRGELFPYPFRGSLSRTTAVNVAHLAVSRLAPESQLARRAFHAVRNWYEAGWPLLDGGRAYVPSLVQDARWDQNYITRREMMRRMRYWSQNSPLVESILSVGERYVVGPAGLHVAFYSVDDTSDDAEDGWYERAELVTKEWFKGCGWNGEDMATLLKVGYRCQRVDGDLGYVKTRKRGPLQLGDELVTVSKPCLQMVEGHRIETPYNHWDQEGRTIVDGVQFREVKVGGQVLMEKTGYWIRNGFGAFEQESTWVLIPIDGMMHLHSSHRVNQFRGLSDFYSVENEIGKLFELLKMEMRAQDEQSQWSVLVKNAAGQFNPIDPKILAAQVARAQNIPLNQQGAQPVDPQKLQNIQEMYRQVYGATTKAFKFGEEAEMKAPARPSESTLQLFEFLINSVCAGTHVPRCLVFGKISAASAKSQGTEVRGELDSANDYFKGDFQKWKRFLHEAVEWFMEWAIVNDPRVADPPANWRHCIHIQQPAACNVDVGHNAQAELMMLAAGASDYDRILGPQGESFNTVARKLARQQRKLEKLNLKVTLPALLPSQIPLDGKTDNSRETVEAT